MKRSELRQIIKEELNKMNEGSIKKGDYVKIDTSKLKKAQSYHPNWEKLVKSLIKRGHGEVYVVNVHKDGKYLEIAESPMGAFIGTATIPSFAVKEE